MKNTPGSFRLSGVTQAYPVVEKVGVEVLLESVLKVNLARLEHNLQFREEGRTPKAGREGRHVEWNQQQTRRPSGSIISRVAGKHKAHAKKRGMYRPVGQPRGTALWASSGIGFNGETGVQSPHALAWR